MNEYEKTTRQIQQEDAESQIQAIIGIKNEDAARRIFMDIITKTKNGEYDHVIHDGV